MDTSEVIVWIILGIVAFLIMILIVRAIFGIPTIINQLQAQSHLLNEIAKQNGVDESRIDIINDEFQVKKIYRFEKIRQEKLGRDER